MHAFPFASSDGLHTPINTCMYLEEESDRLAAACLGGDSPSFPDSEPQDTFTPALIYPHLQAHSLEVPLAGAGEDNVRYTPQLNGMIIIDMLKHVIG